MTRPTPSFATDLALLEQRQRTRTFKFGVLYGLDDQTREEDMFGAGLPPCPSVRRRHGRLT
jgi:hypothetical protein